MSEAKICVVGVIPSRIPGANTYLSLKHIKSGDWRFPGGKPENGELFGQTLVRELIEEIDIEPVVYNVLSTHTVFADGGLWECHFYLVNDYNGLPRVMEPHKHSEIKYLNLYDLINSDADPEFRAISVLESRAVQLVK